MTITPPAPIDAPVLNKQLRATFESGRTRPLAWRRAQLAGMLRMLDEREDELVAALQADLGRPPFEAFVADIGHAKAEIGYLNKHVAGWMKPRKAKVPLTAAPAKARVISEPLGVALVIAPWNYPIQLLIEPRRRCHRGRQLRARQAVASSRRACIAGAGPAAPAVPRSRGGASSSREASRRPPRCSLSAGTTSSSPVPLRSAGSSPRRRRSTSRPPSLELGGKSPTYVHASANLDVAARRIAWGKFLNAGQTCIAPDYVLVDRRGEGPLVERLRHGGRPVLRRRPARRATTTAASSTTGISERLVGLARRRRGHGRRRRPGRRRRSSTSPPRSPSSPAPTAP